MLTTSTSTSTSTARQTPVRPPAPQSVIAYKFSNNGYQIEDAHDPFWKSPHAPSSKKSSAKKRSYDEMDNASTTTVTATTQPTTEQLMEEKEFNKENDATNAPEPIAPQGKFTIVNNGTPVKQRAVLREVDANEMTVYKIILKEADAAKKREMGAGKSAKKEKEQEEYVVDLGDRFRVVTDDSFVPLDNGFEKAMMGMEDGKDDQEDEYAQAWDDEEREEIRKSKFAEYARQMEELMRQKLEESKFKVPTTPGAKPTTCGRPSSTRKAELLPTGTASPASVSKAGRSLFMDQNRIRKRELKPLSQNASPAPKTPQSTQPRSQPQSQTRFEAEFAQPSTPIRSGGLCSSLTPLMRSSMTLGGSPSERSGKRRKC